MGCTSLLEPECQIDQNLIVPIGIETPHRFAMAVVAQGWPERSATKAQLVRCSREKYVLG
jgi:hypothetical protein